MTSGLMGISSQIFIQTTCRELGEIMWVQFLDGLPPKIWDGEKRSKSGAISDNFRLWSRISPERIHKSKIEKVVHQLQPLLRWAEKSWWTSVHKQKSYWRAYWPTHMVRRHFIARQLIAATVNRVPFHRATLHRASICPRVLHLSSEP